MDRYFIKQPGGRIVEVVDKDEEQKWLQQGFKLPTPQEIEQYKQFQVKQYEEAQVAAELDTSGQETDGIYFLSPNNGFQDGYGMSGQQIVQELHKLGQSISTTYAKQKVGIVYHAPYKLASLETPIKILYTMFESDKLPADWNQYLKLADIIIVPSKFCQAVFKNAGFSAEVVPLGYNDQLFKPAICQPHTPYTFLHFDAFNVRKGFMELFKAFVKEFGKDESVKLILKTVRHPAPLPIPPSEYPNIEVVTGPMDSSQLLGLMDKSDCFVFPSRGEGFGLTPLEAMATGLPVIVPNAHGISEYFDQNFMYEVQVEGTTPATYTRYKGQDVGNMLVCSVPDLQLKMRYVYEHQQEASLKGMAASAYAQRFTIRETARQLHEIIERAKTLEVTVKETGNILPMVEV